MAALRESLGLGRDGVRGVVGTMNAAQSRPDWLATVQSGRKQAQSRVCFTQHNTLSLADS